MLTIHAISDQKSFHSPSILQFPTHSTLSNRHKQTQPALAPKCSPHTFSVPIVEAPYVRPGWASASNWLGLALRANTHVTSHDFAWLKQQVNDNWVMACDKCTQGVCVCLYFCSNVDLPIDYSCQRSTGTLCQSLLGEWMCTHSPRQTRQEIQPSLNHADHMLWKLSLSLVTFL